MTLGTTQLLLQSLEWYFLLTYTHVLCALVDFTQTSIKSILQNQNIVLIYKANMERFLRE